MNWRMLSTETKRMPRTFPGRRMTFDLILPELISSYAMLLDIEKRAWICDGRMNSGAMSVVDMHGRCRKHGKRAVTRSNESRHALFIHRIFEPLLSSP
jgi:hypothetical protein